MSSSLVIVGASGLGRAVLDLALDLVDAGRGLDIVGVVDDAPSDRNLALLRQLDVPYVGTSAQWLASVRPCSFVVAIGDPTTREFVASRFQAAGHRPLSLIHPLARISRSAEIGKGTVVAPFVEVANNVSLGAFVHLRPGAMICHDSSVGDFALVSPTAVVAGGASVGARTFLGSGSVILPKIQVGADCTVGASACVTRDVPTGSLVKGVPAR